MACRRFCELMPPPLRHCTPSWVAASNAAQKPRKGPNENAKKIRSPRATPAARKIRFQLSSIHCQLAAVSGHASGSAVVPLV